MKKRLFLLFSLFAGLSACGEDTTDTQPSLEGLTVGSMAVLDGSDSTWPLRQILMCRLLGFGYEWQVSPFIQNPDEAPHLIYTHYTCTDEEQKRYKACMRNSNTHQSFVNLIDGTAELIITARGISRDEKVYADEQGVTLIEKPIARDAFTFMVNPHNPVESLTIAQIQGIYTGQIVNWSEVGGLDEPIVPYIRNRNSGSQEKFETLVMQGLTIADFPVMQIGRTMMTPYYQLEYDQAGIGFTPFYYYSVIVGTGTTKAIGIDGVAMTKENIINGSYPYITNVYAAVRSDTDRSSMAYRLFDFLTTGQGQRIVEESGYVPMDVETGIDAMQKERIRVGEEGRTIALESTSKPVRLRVSDMSGKTIYESNTLTRTINLTAKLTGLCILSVWMEDGSLIRKKVNLSQTSERGVKGE